MAKPRRNTNLEHTRGAAGDPNPEQRSEELPEARPFWDMGETGTLFGTGFEISGPSAFAWWPESDEYVRLKGEWFAWDEWHRSTDHPKGW
jgi:hypothetical protein